MIIENSEALKSWLTSSLASICDADPGALAKYVLALVKKDKEENELYEFCLDQLDVFLLRETKYFVDLLFEALRTKSYLTYKPDSTQLSFTNPKTCNTVSSTVTQDLVTEKVDSEQDKNFQFFEKSTEKASFSKGVGSAASAVSKEINVENNGETPLPDEKYMKSTSIKAHKQDQGESNDKQTENSVDKFAKSSHLNTSVNSHFVSRSHSPSSSVPREKMDEQIKYGIWKEKERGTKTREEYANSERDYKPIEISPPVFKNSSYLLNDNIPGKISKRCQDYDEKGYCMRGDLCQFDHGSDPVVVEDVSILNFGVSIANVTSSDSIVNTIVPDPLVQNVSNSPMQPPPPSSPPPLPPPPPPLPPLPPSDSFCTSSCSFLTSGPYVPEPYNPEAPGMNVTPQSHSVFWGPSNTIHIPPQPLRNSSSTGMPNVQLHHHNSKPHRSRELIGVPTVEVTSSTSINDLQSDVTTSGLKRKGFDFSRLGPKPKKQNVETRCTLEVRKIPRHLNQISSLNNHFSKFGKVTNIQVCFENDPEAALIQFQNHSEATSAYKSAEAVLNNRFIKVFWHSNFKDKTFEVNAEEPTKPTDLSVQATERKSDVPTSNYFMVKREFSAADKTIPDRSVTYSTRGNLCRTVFNPAVVRKPDVVPVASLRTEKDDLKGFSKRLELHKKKQEFLESQIKNQKMILARLGKAKNAKEKIFLKKTIQDLANKITSLEADVKKSSEELMTCLKSFNVQASTKCEIVKLSSKPTCQALEAEKELLDSEMDLYNKQRKGDDTAELNAKVNELRQKAKSLGLLPASTTFLPVGSKQTSQPQMSFPKPTATAIKVDNRPRTLLVLSYQDKETLQKHFEQFGDIEKVDETHKAGTTICFNSRESAEMALQNGKQLEEENLDISWFEEDQQIAAESIEEETVDKEKEDSLLLLDEDEDEEEDSEARSWRR